MVKGGVFFGITIALLAGCFGGNAPERTEPVRTAQIALPCPPPAPAVQPHQPPPAEEDFRPLLRDAHAAQQRGDYATAMRGYERMLATAHDSRNQVRALISIAMIRLLPSSKVHDPVAATVVMQELQRRVTAHNLQHEFFGELELLQLLMVREKELQGLRASDARLRREIAAKEQLIRQLRALTVGGG